MRAPRVHQFGDRTGNFRFRRSRTWTDLPHLCGVRQRSARQAGIDDYHWQHEPCWYAVRTKGNWTGDRKQTTLWTIPSGGQDAETIHGTQKPVECMRRPMLNNSSPGQAIYEPFLGSGTTLIVAQSSGRVCFAIELDPLYVDVAVKRWQAFTGERATLLATGQTFEQVAAGRGATPASPQIEQHVGP
jgi:hypothetical protein